MRRVLLAVLATGILLLVFVIFPGSDSSPDTKVLPEEQDPIQSAAGDDPESDESSASNLDPVFRQRLQELKRWSSPFQDFVIEGHIRSAGDRQPIVGATVGFYDSRNPVTEEFEEVVLETSSDLQGYFSLHSKTHLRGWVLAAKVGYAAVEESIHLAEPGIVVQNFTISPAEGVIQGRALDLFTSSPLPDVRIQWSGASELPAFPSSLSKRITSTDREGRYELTDIPAGPAELEAFLPGFFESTEAVQISAGLNQVDLSLIRGESFTLQIEGDGGEAVAHARVERPDGKIVASDQEGRVEMALMPEFDTIHCGIWADGYLRLDVDLDSRKEFQVVTLQAAPEVRGWVCSTAGEPVVGARLNLQGAGGLVTRPEEPVYSDEFGAFSCGTSYPPLQSIQITHPGYIEEWIQFQEHPVEPISIQLRPRETGLAGSVVDEHGNPVRRFTVVLQRKDTAGYPFRKFFEHPEGRFSISSVAAGVYDLFGFAPQPWETQPGLNVPARELKIRGTARKDVELKRGQVTRLELQLTETAAVAGRPPGRQRSPDTGSR